MRELSSKVKAERIALTAFCVAMAVLAGFMFYTWWVLR